MSVTPEMRSAVVAELLELWEDMKSVQDQIGAMGSETSKGAAEELRIAIGVLEKTYTATELGIPA